MSDLASKKATRWGGECYKTSCPFHWQHEPTCDAESFVITDADFEKRAHCMAGPKVPSSQPMESSYNEQ